MFSKNHIVHGGLDIGNSPLFISVPDKGPKPVIAFVERRDAVKDAEPFPQGKHRGAERLHNQGHQGVTGNQGKCVLKGKSGACCLCGIGGIFDSFYFFQKQGNFTVRDRRDTKLYG